MKIQNRYINLLKLYVILKRKLKRWENKEEVNIEIWNQTYNNLKNEKR